MIRRGTDPRSSSGTFATCPRQGNNTNDPSPGNPRSPVDSSFNAQLSTLLPPRRVPSGIVSPPPPFAPSFSPDTCKGRPRGRRLGLRRGVVRFLEWKNKNASVCMRRGGQRFSRERESAIECEGSRIRQNWEPCEQYTGKGQEAVDGDL